METFLDAYVTAALWSSNDENDEPIDSNYGREDLHPDTLAQMEKECNEFLSKADLTDYPENMAGHDFWLTRNRHGVGFWEVDYGTPEQCQKLTKLAHSFKECHLWVDENGKVNQE